MDTFLAVLVDRLRTSSFVGDVERIDATHVAVTMKGGLHYLLRVETT